MVTNHGAAWKPFLQQSRQLFELRAVRRGAQQMQLHHGRLALRNPPRHNLDPLFAAQHPLPAQPGTSRRNRQPEPISLEAVLSQPAAELPLAFRAIHRRRTEQGGQLIVEIVNTVCDVAEQQVRVEVTPPEGDVREKTDTVSRGCQQSEYGRKPAVNLQIDQNVMAEEFPECA